MTTGSLAEHAETGEHMAEFLAADLGEHEAPPDDVRPANDPGPPDDDQGDEGQGGHRLSTDDFWMAFQAGFAIPQGFDRDFAPLAIQEEEAPEARAASDATYQLLDIYFPGALTTQNQTLMLLAAIVPFGFAKVQTVRAILHHKRERAREQREAASRVGNDNHAPPANENAAPASPTDWMGAQEE